MNAAFSSRHIGPDDKSVKEMLALLKVESLDALMQETLPAAVLDASVKHVFPAKSEPHMSELRMQECLRSIAMRNRYVKNYIGLGFSPAECPATIRRNILENPNWYTQYTPYQAEISQGRLEALANFQTMISDLTGLDIANASLLDEASAAAEAMALCYRHCNNQQHSSKSHSSKSNSSLNEINRRDLFLVHSGIHPATLAVMRTRAEPLGINIEVVDEFNSIGERVCGVFLQYPLSTGAVCNWASVADMCHKAGALVVVSADILGLCILKSPGEFGADIVLGSTQRFGLPLGFGGPHAAYFAVRKELYRELPGRVVGVSRDANLKPCYRLSIQTREQHIRRDKATSNICTAQVLPAVMASMYAVWHGPYGLYAIAEHVHRMTWVLRECLKNILKDALDVQINDAPIFDTITIKLSSSDIERIKIKAAKANINLLYRKDGTIGISLGETVSEDDVLELLNLFSTNLLSEDRKIAFEQIENCLAQYDIKKSLGKFLRSVDYLTHPVFNSYHSETEFVRYVHRLASKDLSLTTSMIPLGSCTMKLNAASEMEPISWAEFANIHPYAPLDQVSGYLELFSQLSRNLANLTGMFAVSLQPNAGSQGEYAGLLAIRAFHKANAQTTQSKTRDVCLIPTSAHGTNPASAVMAGMRVVVIPCDNKGNVDISALQSCAEVHKDELAALMITYPSTHGVFESSIREVCDIVHRYGGQVYMDGANFNAMVGVCRPGDLGVDVCHLNLHKTFSIPHGGGGPGVGPVAAKEHLARFLPGYVDGVSIAEHMTDIENLNLQTSVCTAPWGSAMVMPIPWAYINMMGSEGLCRATKVAILNANYIAERLNKYYPVLYRGEHGRVAHECIFDIRDIKKASGIDVVDIAKRLMDYSFHAPTVSFPVAGTLMVEPTESESKQELDRFCEAMISIRQEIADIESGKADKQNNVLKNAPHTIELVSATSWPFPYSREQAIYPLPWLKSRTYYPPVRRIDDTYGDRNLQCGCV